MAESRLPNYRLLLKNMASQLKNYLKGHFVVVGKEYVPQVPKRIGKFTKKHFNFKKAKARRLIQKLSRRRNRRR